MRLGPAILVAALGCGASNVVHPSIDRSFTLQPAQRAEFPDQQISITFRAVRADGRCPRTVVCVWEGNAEIQLEVSVQNVSQVIDLNTAVEPRDAVIGAYRLRLRSLAPQPPVRPADYLLTLELSRN